jgi:hypothetical protein
LAVKDLLLDNYKAWDIAKIRTLFLGPTANLFIKTPLTASVHIYKLVWVEERNGCYSVKSGYNLAMRHISAVINFMWRIIGMIFGKLKIPTKLDIYFGINVGVVSRR